MNYRKYIILQTAQHKKMLGDIIFWSTKFSHQMLILTSTDLYKTQNDWFLYQMILIKSILIYYWS